MGNLPAKTLSVTIQRGAAGAFRLQTYDVPAQDSQTVLDVVTWIQRNTEPTLAYRFACRVGMCGSCAMMVNGVPRWTCRTHVQIVQRAGRLSIGPLRNLPVIRDLVVDMEPFFEKWTRAGGHHHPTRDRTAPTARIDPQAAARRTANAGIECINCAVCHAACDTVAASPAYLGPAPLQRAWTLLNDSRDARGDAILDQVAGSGGCQSCHSMGSCTAHCPNGLDPLAAIAGLKRAATRRALRRRG